MFRLVFHTMAVFSLTLLTQLGGLARIVGMFFRRKAATFLIVYLAFFSAAMVVAPVFGRVPLNCFDRGPLQVQSWMYCAFNRNYVTPELASVLEDTAIALGRIYPGTETLVLDASFPFF